MHARRVAGGGGAPRTARERRGGGLICGAGRGAADAACTARWRTETGRRLRGVGRRGGRWRAQLRQSGGAATPRPRSCAALGCGAAQSGGVVHARRVAGGGLNCGEGRGGCGLNGAGAARRRPDLRGGAQRMRRALRGGGLKRGGGWAGSGGEVVGGVHNSANPVVPRRRARGVARPAPAELLEVAELCTPGGGCARTAAAAPRGGAMQRPVGTEDRRRAACGDGVAAGRRVGDGGGRRAAGGDRG